MSLLNSLHRLEKSIVTTLVHIDANGMYKYLFLKKLFFLVLIWYKCIYFLKQVLMSFDKEITHGGRDSKQYTRYILQYNVLPANFVLSVSHYVPRGGGGCYVVHENLVIFIYV